MFLSQLSKLVNIIKEFDIPSYLSIYTNDHCNKNNTNEIKIPIKTITLKPKTTNVRPTVKILMISSQIQTLF